MSDFSTDVRIHGNRKNEQPDDEDTERTSVSWITTKSSSITVNNSIILLMLLNFYLNFDRAAVMNKRVSFTAQKCAAAMSQIPLTWPSYDQGSNQIYLEAL